MRTLPGHRQRVVTSIVTLGLIFHAGALDLPAQESRVAPGTRVRFELRSGERFDGRVISLGRDTLEAGFPPNGVAARYPLGNISKLEVVSGQRRPVLRGLAVGAGVGVVVGGLAGALSYSPCESKEIFGCLLAPTSRSESATVEPSATDPSLLMAPPSKSRASFNDVLPEPRWPTIATFLMRCAPLCATSSSFPRPAGMEILGEVAVTRL